MRRIYYISIARQNISHLKCNSSWLDPYLFNTGPGMNDPNDILPTKICAKYDRRIGVKILVCSIAVV